MNSSHVTLNEFFFPRKKLRREQLSVIESGQNMSVIKDKVTEARVKWPVAFDTVVKKIPDILNISILNISIPDIMISAFKKYGILLKYLDRNKYPPDEVFLVSMAERTIKSEYRPSIEILINGQTVGKIEFDITISLILNGIILKIQDGKIKEVITAILSHHYLERHQRCQATQICYQLLDDRGIFITVENIIPCTQQGTLLGLDRWKRFQVEHGRTNSAAEEHVRRFNSKYFPITVNEHFELLQKTGFQVVELFWISHMQAGFYAIK